MHRKDSANGSPVFTEVNQTLFTIKTMLRKQGSFL